LLSEQVNPHFLYNTLEEIQSEIMLNQNEIANNMLQALTLYLRIGLAKGAAEISIQQEISHVKSYIDIMNQRFNQQVFIFFLR
jgi:two-component system sensor histidine kinase YesM